MHKSEALLGILSLKEGCDNGLLRNTLKNINIFVQVVQNSLLDARMILSTKNVSKQYFTINYNNIIIIIHIFGPLFVRGPRSKEKRTLPITN